MTENDVDGLRGLSILSTRLTRLLLQKRRDSPEPSLFDPTYLIDLPFVYCPRLLISFTGYTSVCVRFNSDVAEQGSGYRRCMMLDDQQY